MHRSFILILLLSLFVTAACAQHEPDFRDVSYAADSLTGHRLDIYLPETGEAPYPVVVIIAGSAFFGNDTKAWAYRTMGAALREAGYAVVAINHRSSREAIFPAQIHDVRAAIRFIRANAGKYGLDATRIAITGDSSGGHLASMAGLAGGVDAYTVGSHTLALEGDVGGNAGVDSRVAAVVAWYPPTRFLVMNSCGSGMDHDAADSPASILIGGPIQENPDLSALADPITYVDPSDPPFLLFHGDADPVVPHCQSELLYAALQDAGVESRLVIVPGGGHGQGMWTPENVAQMVQFFDTHLR
ncbi:MAG TPA: alpha/beta hydrolase [Rhodothermales bacterium]